MKLAIMQPYLFPYIGYFQLLGAADKFVVFDDVNFIKKGWINKNFILVNSQPHAFTVPLQNASQNKLIKDTEISTDDKWRGKFLQTLRQNYRKAKHFDEIFSTVETIVCSGETLISKMILQSLQILKEKFELKTEIAVSSEIYANRELKGQERILDICKRENAAQYINAAGGAELYDREKFAACGIKLSFLQTAPISYEQFGNQFVPNLSIIDVLMFNGFERTRKLLSNYILT